MQDRSMKLGEILVGRGVINLAQMHEAICKHRSLRKRLGEMLIDLEMATPAQIAEGLSEQERRNQR